MPFKVAITYGNPGFEQDMPLWCTKRKLTTALEPNFYRRKYASYQWTDSIFKVFQRGQLIFKGG